MRVPEAPPKTGDDASSQFWRQLEAKLLPLEDGYLHWDQLKDKKIPITGVNHKQWWQLLKAKRRARTQTLELVGAQGQTYSWVLDDRVVKKLMSVERYLRTQLQPLFNQCVPCEAFIGEAVANGLLQGVPISAEVGHELLATGRPATETEMPIGRYYQALMELFNVCHQPLDEALLLQFYQIVSNQDAVIASEARQSILQLCAFANQPDEDYPGFMHPIIKAALLYYLLIEIKPFAESNEAVANLLFYWELLKSGYVVLASVAVSAAIRQQFETYQQSLLFVATDDYDVTYFLLQQLDALLLAMANYQTELSDRLLAVARMMQDPKTASLNERQLTILHEMRQHPEWEYRLAAYKERFDVTYETSRTDLMYLERDQLAKQHKIGKAFVYSIA